MKCSIFSFASLCLVLLLVSGCKKNGPGPGIPDTPGPDNKFYAVTEDNQLLYLNAKNISYYEKEVSISGLESGERFAGIDFRPNTGQLFGISTAGQLYVINAQTGAATKTGSAGSTHGVMGSVMGFDFNPTVDRIRVVTGSGQNYRFNPETGALAFTDGSINGAPGAAVTAVAYTGSVAGATATTLYDIDVVNNKLYRQDPPNAGTLVEVGDLSVDLTATAGFDIGSDGTAMAVFTVNGRQSLFTINLQTGKASKRGDFKQRIVAMAIPTAPVAYAITLTNNLLVFNPATGKSSFEKTISGLQADEKLLGLDMRPATGQLYALGSSSRVYVVNIASGVATAVGTGPLGTLLEGSDFGFDFNPTVDRIRVVSNTGQNLRLHPVEGTVVMVDGRINPADSYITGAAYTNNFSGAKTTVLFGIDSKTDHLVRQDPPNAGTIVDIGALGVDVDGMNGFDISGNGGVAYAAFTSAGTTRIYTVDLNTGKAAAVVAMPAPVRGFTLGLGL